MRVLAAVLVLLASSCGGDDEPVSVSAARERSGAVEVEGYLIERGGELRLCDGILESFPPQCGEPSLRVVGSGLSPSEDRVTLLGEVKDGVLRIR